MMPTFWQLYNGEKNVGLTIHYMVERIDEGEALLQESLAVEPGESLDQLIRRSKRHAAHCLAHVLEGIRSRSQQVVHMQAAFCGWQDGARPAAASLS
jgi:methionyl-tRNA formyltransferase